MSGRCRCGRFSDGGLCVRCDAKERRIFIEYPVVFYNGRREAIGTLRLPENLRRTESERIQAMLDALVIDEVAA